MIASPKMNQTCFIVLCRSESINIVEGVIAGAYKAECYGEDLRYIVDTCLGRYERFSSGLYASPEDVASHIEDFVVKAS